MTQTNIEQERIDFETWHKIEYPFSDCEILNNGIYKEQVVFERFIGWKAALKLERERQASEAVAWGYAEKSGITAFRADVINNWSSENKKRMSEPLFTAPQQSSMLAEFELVLIQLKNACTRMQEANIYADFCKESRALISRIEKFPLVAPQQAYIPREILACLPEANMFGQFSDDFDYPLAKPIRKAIRDLLQANIPDGWKLVPIEPTDEMIEASWNLVGMTNTQPRKSIRIAWFNMLSAAPTAPIETQDTVHKVLHIAKDNINLALRGYINKEDLIATIEIIERALNLNMQADEKDK